MWGWAAAARSEPSAADAYAALRGYDAAQGDGVGAALLPCLRGLWGSARSGAASAARAHSRCGRRWPHYIRQHIGHVRDLRVFISTGLVQDANIRLRWRNAVCHQMFANLAQAHATIAQLGGKSNRFHFVRYRILAENIRDSASIPTLTAWRCDLLCAQSPANLAKR